MKLLTHNQVIGTHDVLLFWFVVFCICLHSSEQLCASELQARRTSISSGDKIVSDLQAHQDQAENELDPDRDIELELCALDMEDSDHQEIKSQVGANMFCIT